MEQWYHIHLAGNTCETCGNAYKATRSLQAHIATLHRGERNFVCEECGKQFTQINSLHTHILANTGSAYIFQTASQKVDKCSELMSYWVDSSGATFLRGRGDLGLGHPAPRTLYMLDQVSPDSLTLFRGALSQSFLTSTTYSNQRRKYHNNNS